MCTYGSNKLPLHFVNVEGEKVLVLLAACFTAAKHVHAIAVDDRGLMTDGSGPLVVLARRGLHELPLEDALLVLWLLVKIVEVFEVDHPQVVHAAFADIVATVDVHFAAVDESAVIATALRYLALKTYLEPVGIRLRLAR